MKRLLSFLPVPPSPFYPQLFSSINPNGNEGQTLELKGGWLLGAWLQRGSWVTTRLPQSWKMLAESAPRRLRAVRKPGPGGGGGGCALRTCRCFPGPCPSAAGSPGKPATKTSIYSHLCWLVPVWLSSKHLRVPVPLADKAREGLEG